MQLYTDANGVQKLLLAGSIAINSDTGAPMLPVIWDSNVHGGTVDPAKVGGYLNSNLDWSQAAFDANAALIASVAATEADAFKLQLRTLFNSAVDGSTPEGFAARTILLTILDETNRLRAWITSFKAAVAAATSLGNLQTRVAALNNMPEVSAATMKTALADKANSGLAD